MTSTVEHDEMIDLLAARSLRGLTPAEQGRLEVLIVRHERATGQTYCQGHFDWAVATLAVAEAELDLADASEPLPGSLRRRLTDAARDLEDDGARAPLRFVADAEEPAVATASSGSPWGFLTWAGWTAAAACVGLALLAAWPAPSTISATERAVTLARDGIRADLASITAIDAPAPHSYDLGVAGRIVWSDEADTGYIELAGLQANDPAKEQYQLWIFDAERPVGDLPGMDPEGGSGILSQRPVDGGVFDFKPGPDGKARIPIDAKLPVGKAAIFAVTLEPPGGVVVSERDIVCLALRPS